MPLKHQLRDYFLFSRKDRIAVIFLLVIIGFALCMPYVVRPVVATAADQDSAWVQAVERLLAPGGEGSSVMDDHTIRDSLKNSGDTYNNAGAVKLFPFDPNTLEKEGWLRLGVRERTVETIIKYRSKGGRFKSAADLEKIYGLEPKLAAGLRPYVNISRTDHGRPQEKKWADYPRNAEARREPGIVAANRPDVPGRPYQKSRNCQVVDLNKADTTALISLPCIGSKLAARIIQFREKLGGFYSIDQLRETYGITDSAFNVVRPWLNVNPLDCRLIAINDVTLDQLKLHPYLRFDLARTIIAWRQEHGGFQSLEDLKKVSALPAETYQRILPYLRL